MSLSRSFPDNLDYIFTLADLARIQKNWDMAIDYYIQGHEIDPMAVNGLEQALQIALTTSKFYRAEEICDLLIMDDPVNLDLLETMRDLTLYNGNYEKSLEIVGKIEKLKGVDSNLLIQKSALYEELENPGLALETMYIAFEQDSQNVDILHRLVTLLIGQERSQAVSYTHLTLPTIYSV